MEGRQSWSAWTGNVGPEYLPIESSLKLADREGALQQWNCSVIRNGLPESFDVEAADCSSAQRAQYTCRESHEPERRKVGIVNRQLWWRDAKTHGSASPVKRSFGESHRAMMNMPLLLHLRWTYIVRPKSKAKGTDLNHEFAPSPGGEHMIRDVMCVPRRGKASRPVKVPRRSGLANIGTRAV